METKIITTMGNILDSGNWGVYCDKYGINEWCMDEGLAGRDTEVQIKLEDAKRWGLLEDQENENL